MSCGIEYPKHIMAKIQYLLTIIIHIVGKLIRNTVTEHLNKYELIGGSQYRFVNG